MKLNLKLNNIFITAFLLPITIGVFLRFYNLNWGAPYYFHPDERNIASSVTRLEFPENLNPEFFAYGTLPIYSIYGIGLFQNFISSMATEQSFSLSVSFEQAIIISRIISAIFSSLLILLIAYSLRKKLGVWYSLLGLSLAAFNVGFIQYAHFGTFEIWLAFLFFLLYMSLLEYIKNKKLFQLVLSGVLLGLLIAVKISSIIILPIILIIIFWREYKLSAKKSVLATLKKNLLLSVFLLFISGFVVFITFPYLFFDINSFLQSMGYESGVALGTIAVFYTGGFAETVSIVYQLGFVYPFLVNPVILIFFLLFLPSMLLYIRKTHNKLVIFILIFSLAIFISQAFLYVKWTRYYVPTIPFIIIATIYGFKIFIEGIKHKKLKTPIALIIVVLLISSSIIYSLSYFFTVTDKPFTTVTASAFAESTIPKNAKIISEIYDLGIIPFNKNFKNITLFDFYALDDRWNRESKREELDNLIENSDYLILPSQRILRNRMLYPDKFPEGNAFYSNLQTDKFELIYETPCDLFCKILYVGDPIFNIEETANVFDRPFVMIFKINK